MPRGLGSVQKEIIECLRSGGAYTPCELAARIECLRNGGECSVLELAARMAEPHTPTPAMRASVRRALRSLHRRGIVSLVSTMYMLLEDAHASDRDTIDDITPPPKVHNEEREFRERLAKLLGMLGSDFQGERESAARRIEELRQRHGVSWAEIIER